MSRQWNSQKVVVLFGDRIREGDLEVEATGIRIFADRDDFEWLAALGQRLHIAVIAS